jgi:mono/diheme cytochrome c family protein
VSRGFQRGREIYEQRCADCHGRSGRDFGGARVGQITPLGQIGTDPNAARSHTRELAGRMNLVPIGNRLMLSQFSKPEVEGYVNLPLDGLWLRAPYLHNGSVPTVRDLLEPAARRPRVFYRGGDLYDDARMGFVSDQPQEDGRPLFKYYTGLAGNSNAGHEGPVFGTTLTPEDKDDLVDYLKSF